MEEKQIAIIGAGISGLLACKYTLSKGFHPVVFEAKSSVGGVWLNTIENTKLQTPKTHYQFSDFPWPNSVKDNDSPDQHQVYDYIQSYAQHFDLLKHIRFNTRVLGIQYQGPSDEEMGCWSLWSGNGQPFGSGSDTWRIEVQDTQTLLTQEYQVKFVIVCIGRFSDVPNIPEFPKGKGPEAFHGKVMHSMEYANMEDKSAAELIKGKRIAIVGFQKSALDIAMECSAANGIERPCRVLYKTEHWSLPDLFPWGVSLRWALSKFVESHIKRKLPLTKYSVVPKHSFLEELSSCYVSILLENFYDKVEEGSIILKKAPSFSFCAQGIKIDGDDSHLDADLVILATGFKGEQKLRDIFVSKTFQERVAGSPTSIAEVGLYRECIHPGIPQLALIGYSYSVVNLYTSEMQCKWVAEFLDGKLKLPSIEEMQKDMDKWDRYKKYCSSGQYYNRACIGPLHMAYNDQLCKDMGWNPKRKRGFWAEFFEPYTSIDYASP